MMGQGLHGKRVVVIGGTSGIGFAVAQAALAARRASSSPPAARTTSSRLWSGWARGRTAR